MAKKAAKRSASDELDHRMAAEALGKRQRGETPTTREASALKRVEKAREERLREEYYRSVPKKHFLEMAGRQANAVNGMGRTWDMPIFGRGVDLYKFIPWVFDWLAVNKYKLKHLLDGAPLDDPLSQAKAEYQLERTLLVRGRRQRADGSMMDRAEVREALAAISGIYRRAGERLRREFGEEAYRIIDECWNDVTRMIEQRFGERGNGEEKG